MNDDINTEAAKIADQNQVLPEEVDVLDLSQKPKHLWEHRGLRHTCVIGTHPRHFFISKAG